jgi:hypothetical protein
VKLLWQVPLHVLPTVLLGAQLKVALSTVGEVGQTTGGMGGTAADATWAAAGPNQPVEAGVLTRLLLKQCCINRIAASTVPKQSYWTADVLLNKH